MVVQLSPIEAHERTLGQIFSDQYAFEIPSYQRPYAWEEEEARALLTDLLDAMENEATTGGVYFLGSIVLIKLPNQPVAKVIDGQQRLATLTVLLSVLRDLTTSEERRFDRGTYIFQKANADRGTSDRLRLLLRPRDRAFFLQTVQEPRATSVLRDVSMLKGSQQRIAENSRFFKEQLELIEESKRDELVAFIIQRCYLVVVAVPTAESARKIFTVLNARGLDLTATDILKADLLDRAGEPKEMDLAERWEAVELAVGRDGMVELFGHIRMMHEREKPRLALEAGFPKFVGSFTGDAHLFISNILEPVSDAFALVLNDKAFEKQFGPEAAKAVRSLARIDNKDWLPPILLRLLRSEGEREAVAEFVAALERLAYFLFVTRAGINERIKRYALVMDEIDPRGKEASGALPLSDAEQAEFLRALNGPIYLKGRVCKPVLQRLDEALSTGGASYDALVSIEHVLPQTVGEDSEWAKLFPDEQLRADWTHRLANLVLLTRRINTRASNWAFSKKKAEYFSSNGESSPFVITQGVLRTERWTLQHLVERQGELLGKLASMWSLNLSRLGDGAPSAERFRGSRDFTDTKLIQNKRDAVMNAYGSFEGFEPISVSGALFSNPERDFRAVCTISKRYVAGPPYWYGYSPQWDAFLSESKRSFLVLACMDRDVAYAIPHERIRAILGHLPRSSERHWHIVLEQSEAGDLELVVSKTVSPIQLREFEFDLGGNRLLSLPPPSSTKPR